MKRTYFALAALALVALVAIAGCGGGGSSSSSESTSASSSGAAESETASSGGRSYGNESESAAGGEKESAAAEEETEAAAGGESTGSGTVAVVKVMNTPDLGKVIVDAEGMTMYDFHKDKGSTSACYGACAQAWPPLLTSGKPKVEGGAEASLVGVTKRKDGTEQVTYNGHPIYGFVEDQKPGETNGNDFKGFGGQWYALMPNGEEPADG